MIHPKVCLSFSGGFIVFLLTTIILLQHIYLKQIPNVVTVKQSLPQESSNVPLTQTYKPIACLVFGGRLGNLMFQYAFLHVISKSKNLYPIVPERFELSNYFALPEYESHEQNRRRQECDQIQPRELERWACSYDEKFPKLATNKSIFFHGYFQSWKYWTGYEDEIRQMFTFNSDILEEARDKLSEVLNEMGYEDSPNDVVVAIHSRRGDYLRKDLKEFGYITPNASYYRNAMEFFRKKFHEKRVFFVAASNDINWLREQLGKEENIFFLQNNPPFIDMAVLSLCNHVIMSSGTFGWWAGWMSRGTVVYYKHLYTPGSIYASTFRNGDVMDFIYPGWIGLS